VNRELKHNSGRSIYGKDGVSDFMAIINDCRHLLSTDLVNSDMSFIRRQVNGVAHSLAKEALFHASLQIHRNIPHRNNLASLLIQ